MKTDDLIERSKLIPSTMFTHNQPDEILDYSTEAGVKLFVHQVIHLSQLNGELYVSLQICWLPHSDRCALAQDLEYIDDRTHKF